MKETISLDKAKQLMSKINVVIYGTIRDIESHFLCSFTNVEIIASYFKSALIIILENDSNDKTRSLLTKWSELKMENIKKHIILKNNLDEQIPLRAHRLAYCRNEILKYMRKNDLSKQYEYAIHCDLDDRFWCIDFESICNCFQYDSSEWDVMTCVNKNRSYYDYWALRCSESWFNINIFSCAAKGIDYNTKIEEFEHLLKNTPKLLKTNSSFNGLGVYKMTSLLKGEYNADYYCRSCNNTNRGCYEDNDHIGLHKNIIENGGNIFINVKMRIQTRPENVMNYDNFLEHIQHVKNVKKYPLLYLLVKNKINTDGLWLSVGVKDGEVNNMISNYKDKLIVFDENLKKMPIYVNKNIVHHNKLNTLQSVLLSKNQITFINFNHCSYRAVKKILSEFISYISNTCILYFKNMINYDNFELDGIKALYEVIEEKGIKISFYCVNNEKNNLFQDAHSLAIKIIKNPLLNSDIHIQPQMSEEYNNFDWVFYTTFYDDLIHIKSKKEAWEHWINHGKSENRIIEKQDDTNEYNLENDEEYNNFDWEVYSMLNTDLIFQNKNKKEVWNHWIVHGKREKRACTFNWLAFVQNYNLDILHNIDSKEKAIQYWLDNGRPDIHNSLIKNITIDYEDKLFDWKYYVSTHEDLKNITTKESAWEHWINHGKMENRVCHNFNWIHYLSLNNDLLAQGIDNKVKAIKHWTEIGFSEGRKYQ